MATTRMKVSSNATVFHRVAGVQDMPQHDIGTSDSAVSGLGGSADFQIDSDDVWGTSMPELFKKNYTADFLMSSGDKIEWN